MTINRYNFLMVKSEILKYLMHFRKLDPEQIINKTYAHLNIVLGEIN